MEEHSFVDKHQFTEDILKMLDRGSTNDVKIKLRDGEIVANKDILMARSDYFAAMLSNNKFVEGETGSVDMSHCSKLAMEKIIKFLFSGEVSFDQMPLAHHLELIHMTDMMLLTEFKHKVEDFVVNKMESNEETVEVFPELFSGLRLADQYNLTKIKETIISELYFYLSYLSPDHVKALDSFKTLPFNFIRDIFLCDCKLYHIPSSSALHRLEAFMVWLSENKVTEEQKKEIVESFTFEEFSAEDLLTGVRDSGLFSSKKIDERLLDILKKKDQLLKEKEKKINELRKTIEVTTKYPIPPYLKY